MNNSPRSSSKLFHRLDWEAKVSLPVSATRSAEGPFGSETGACRIERPDFENSRFTEFGRQFGRPSFETGGSTPPQHESVQPVRCSTGWYNCMDAEFSLSLWLLRCCAFCLQHIQLTHSKSGSRWYPGLTVSRLVAGLVLEHNNSNTRTPNTIRSSSRQSALATV